MNPRDLPARTALGAVLGSIAALLALLCFAAPAGAATVQATPLPFAGGADDLIVGPDGALWFAGRERDEVDRFDPGTGALQRFPLARREDEGENEGPTDLAAGAEGQVWYITDDGRETGRLSPSGVVQPIYYGESDLFVGHISAAPGGGVWESVQTNYDNLDSELALLRGDGTLTTYAYEGKYSSGGPISTAPDGSAWVGDWGARISGITPAGGVASYPTAIGSTEEINSIAFGPDGSVWYAGFTPEVSAGTAFVSAGGGSIGHLVPGGSPQGFKVGQNTLTGSITSAGDGSMWFAARGGVGRIEPSGAYQLGSTAPYQPGASLSPDNLVYGPQGALWFIDDEKSALVRVAVDGALFPPAPAPPAPAPAPPAPKPAPKPKPRAAGVTIKGGQVRVKTIEKRHGIPVNCALKDSGRCSVTVAAAARYAKTLHLKTAKKAKTVTLGQASKDFKKAGTQTLLVKLKPKILRALRHLRGKIDLRVEATSSAPGATATIAAAKLSLRR